MSDAVSEGSRIQRSTRSRTRKKKPNQIPFGIGVLFLIVVIGFLLNRVSPTLGLFWLVGNAFGYILQKARFCFTAAMRGSLPHRRYQSDQRGPGGLRADLYRVSGNQVRSLRQGAAHSRAELTSSR